MLSSLNSRLKLILLAVIILTAGIGFFWILFDRFGDSINQDVHTDKELPSGALLLSYASVDRQTDSASLFPALLSFSTGEVTYIESDQNGQTLSGFHHSMSLNDQWMTFIGSSAPNESWPNAIYRVSLQTKDVPAIILTMASAVPALEAVRAAFPDISDNGDIIYMSMPTTTDLAIEDFYVNFETPWDIVWLNQANEEKRITQGLHPQWLGNENFLFLKGDGVYQYSISDHREIRLIPSLSMVGPSHRLVLSEDGTQALLIEPPVGAVRLFDVIRDPDGVSLQERDPIMVNATSAVFSPDGNMVAITILPANGLDIPLVVYDRAGNEIYRSILPDASLTFTSLQAWMR